MIGIIVGAGRIGYNLASSMYEKHDITLIEKDKTQCEKIANLLDCYIIHGTATNTKLLEEADIDNADFFVAATANDEVNLLSSVYAKDHGVKKVISRLNNVEHRDIFAKLDIPFINPERSATRYMVRNIVRPTAQRLVSVGKGDAEILEIVVKNKDVLFTPVRDIQNNTDKFIIITIYSGKEEIIPTNESELDYNDRIIVLVKQEYMDEVRQFFTKKD
ncbi:MAG: TrkA family potassium uptake protein [Methanosphaera sp.]|nr:TrkA family potassium uptake protein [Methanosphaera sp.]